jgi:hypothetical protein
MPIRDPGCKKFGSGKEKFLIRDKHPGSATLIKRGLIFSSSNEYFLVKPAGENTDKSWQQC